MYTNNSNIPLAMAVWLMHDEYDYVKKEGYISATALMKPLRHIILGKRNKNAAPQDIEGKIPSALGHSLHDSIEKAWVNGNHVTNMKKLGYPDSIIARILVNPSKEDLDKFNGFAKPGEEAVAVYLEQRATRTVIVNGVTYLVGGKFDMVADGIVMDNKSTTAYTWVYGGKDDDYQLQLSIYRWLNPDKVVADFGRINFIFTDWQRASARQNPKYPQSRLEYKDIPLMSDKETDNWVTEKLKLIQVHQDTPEAELPECTDAELWIGDPEFKFFLKEETYKNGGKCTKNCSTMAEAKEYQASKGGRGVIVTIVGKPKRCGYCPGFEVCTQKDKYFT